MQAHKSLIRQQINEGPTSHHSWKLLSQLWGMRYVEVLKMLNKRCLFVETSL